MTETQFKQALLDHDWYFDYSEDSRVWKAGSKSLNVLRTHAATHPWFKILFEHAERQVFTAKAPIEPFPTNPGTVAGPSETTTQTDNTPMANENTNALLGLITAALVTPIVEALDRLAAATSGKNVCTGSVAPAPADDEAPTPPKKPRKAKTEEAPAPAPEPAPAAASTDDDDAPTATGPTLEDVKAFVKSVTDKDKQARFIAWMEKKYGVKKTAELPVDSYGVTIEALKKIGATDSRIPVAAPDADDEI